ncbi:MAG: glycosyltransferase family 4 protein [Gammaproteobacteria bacterium]|nr:glycosyltransferase family 4 protein [Gammaproteobacteria bacterium]
MSKTLLCAHRQFMVWVIVGQHNLNTLLFTFYYSHTADKQGLYVNSMRIGIDATCWANPRGYGRFTRHMLTALLEQDQVNEYVFFIDSFMAEGSEFPGNAGRRVVELSASPTQAASAEGRRSIGDMLKMGRAVAREPLDVFFYPSVYTYFPVFSRVKKIVAIHDVIAEKYPELIFSNRKSQFFWDLKTRLAIWQSDLVLTVSEFSKKGIVDHFALDPQHVAVVSEGSADAFYPLDDTRAINEVMSRHDMVPDTRFILYVGGIAPHKNLAVLVEAFDRLVAEGRYDDVRLVLVGDYENDVFLIDDAIKARMKDPTFRKRVISTGYIPDDDLNALYNAATVFVLPSFCEGFGLPALEAMSCGTVVIGSDTTSIPEVVGEAGLFFDPDNASQLAVHLRTVLGDAVLREELQQRSLQRAATFSWKRSAEDTLGVLSLLDAS